MIEDPAVWIEPMPALDGPVTCYRVRVRGYNGETWTVATGGFGGKGPAGLLPVARKWADRMDVPRDLVRMDIPAKIIKLPDRPPKEDLKK